MTLINSRSPTIQSPQISSPHLNISQSAALSPPPISQPSPNITPTILNFSSPSITSRKRKDPYIMTPILASPNPGSLSQSQNSVRTPLNVSTDKMVPPPGTDETANFYIPASSFFSNSFFNQLNSANNSSSSPPLNPPNPNIQNSNSNSNNSGPLSLQNQIASLQNQINMNQMLLNHINQGEGFGMFNSLTINPGLTPNTFTNVHVPQQNNNMSHLHHHHNGMINNGTNNIPVPLFKDPLNSNSKLIHVNKNTKYYQADKIGRGRVGTVFKGIRTEYEGKSFFSFFLIFF